MIRIILLSCLLWAAPVFAVSKVGGGTLWNPEVGFSSLLPDALTKYTIFSNDAVRGEGPPVFDGKGMVPQAQEVNVFMLPVEQPAWGFVDDPAVFRHHFTQKGWTEYSHADPCVIIFRKQGPSFVTFIMNWGLGYGIMVNSNLVEANQESAKKIVDTLTRTMECKWK